MAKYKIKIKNLLKNQINIHVVFKKFKNWIYFWIQIAYHNSLSIIFLSKHGLFEIEKNKTKNNYLIIWPTDTVFN